MKWQEINKEEYQNYLKKVLFKTFFHKTGWQDILAKEFGFKFRYFKYPPAGEAGGDKLILSAADLGNNKFFSLPFCEYGGPLPLTSGLDFPEFPNLKMRFHPQILAYFSEKLAGAQSQFKTYWLETKNKSEQEIWQSFRKTLRHEIEKAKELEILTCQNQKKLKNFYELYVKTIKSKGNLILPFACFEYLHNKAEVLLAYHQGELVAGSVFLRYGNFVHYYLNASKDKKFNANHLLLWHKIKDSIGLTFDFGSDGGNPDLAIFKSGWGTTAKPILEIGFDNQTEKKNWGRNLFKLLPDFLAVSISKKLAKRVL